MFLDRKLTHAPDQPEGGLIGHLLRHKLDKPGFGVVAKGIAAQLQSMVPLV